MPDRSGAAIFGTSRWGPKLVREATHSEGLWLDLRHGGSPQGGSTLCLSGTGGHRLRPVISAFIHVPLRNSYGLFSGDELKRRRLRVIWRCYARDPRAAAKAWADITQNISCGPSDWRANRSLEKTLAKSLSSVDDDLIDLLL